MEDTPKDWNWLCTECNRSAQESFELLRKLAQEEKDITVRSQLRRASWFCKMPDLVTELSAEIAVQEIWIENITREARQSHENIYPTNRGTAGEDGM